jgi:4'-phosphopantetheinyl transferase
VSAYTTPYLDALAAEVHVWLARPDPVRYGAAQLALLDATEQDRYRRLRYPDDRRLFLTAHVLVRRALSLYTVVDPAAWRFASHAHGRPELAAPALPVNLRFNLSHTAGLAACVVSVDEACGVDVERVTARRNLPGIAARVFAPPERRDLEARGDGRDYVDRFYTYWTLREAWSKALGTGLAHADRSAWFEPDGVCTLHAGRAGTVPGGDWQCAVLRPTGDHRLAVVQAVGAGGRRPVLCRFLVP